MVPELLYMICGLTAGLIGGYLGLGGGEIIVPFLAIGLGVDIKAAVPVSVVAIVVNSMSSSTEYVRTGMVDMELTIAVAIFMVMGNITGSTVSVAVSAQMVQAVLTVLLVYTAFSLLKGRPPRARLVFADNRRRYMGVVIALSFLIGCVAGLVGVGGGVFLVPLLYLVIGCPLATARGTTSVIISISAASAAAVYFLHGAIDFAIVAPVVFGILIGGRIGGYFGTTAKPIVIRILFFVVMLYLAYRLGAETVENWL
ncbi:MAG: sulfite exporter TauE/SafE family protein [Alphaproteobacteria bacterium]|nr:sulfite exporter TauE/SafE family protein [Alphaproteobacteria bacterium]